MVRILRLLTIIGLAALLTGCFRQAEDSFEDVTLDVNHQASVNIARMAKASGVKSFVFASSCSIYGAGGDEDKAETSELNPLTAYAHSICFPVKYWH